MQRNNAITYGRVRQINAYLYIDDSYGMLRVTENPVIHDRQKLNKIIIKCITCNVEFNLIYATLQN